MNKTLAHLLTFWIPLAGIRRSCRKRLRNPAPPEREESPKAVEQAVNIAPTESAECSESTESPESAESLHLKALLSDAKQKIQRGEKLRVGFYVVFNSVFPGKSLFEKMLEDDLFDPFILIIPDVARGHNHMIEQLGKSYQDLSQAFGGAVLKSYDAQTEEFKDYSGDVDIVCMANPYDAMTHELYQSDYVGHKSLIVFIPYAYSLYTECRNMFGLPFISNCWRVFLEYQDLLPEYQQRHHRLSPDTFVVTGFPRIDELFKRRELTQKKRIIIAPHSKYANKPEFGAFFDNFSDLIQQLPKRYPDIEFVFRPHPLLFVQLVNEWGWTQQKIDDYIQEMTDNRNVIYEQGGDFSYNFINSDGLIHDGGSFCAEYLFTKNPCCFVKYGIIDASDKLLPQGAKCVAMHYPATSDADIIDFIEHIVRDGCDTMKDERLAFVEQCLAADYPNTTQNILNNIKSNFQ